MIVAYDTLLMVFFVIGMITALSNGLNLLFSSQDWKRAAIDIAGGTVGALMMFGALVVAR